MRQRHPIRVLFVLLLLAVGAPAQLRLPAFFGDHMVLQQDCEVDLSGRDAVGTTIVVSASWLPAPLTTMADAEGHFSVSLPTPRAGGPHRLEVAGSSKKVIEDILAGELWIASGQSNMEMSLGECRPEEEGGQAAFDAELTADIRPMIRFFAVANRTSAQPLADVEGEWIEARRDTIEEFSAVAYHFARALHDARKVPVGVIAADWGGTRIEAWMPLEDLRTFDFLGEELVTVEEERRAPGTLESRNARADADWWRQVDAMPGATPLPDRPDDAPEWFDREVPGVFDGALANFDGVVWLRRRFTVPEDRPSGPAWLELGPIDDFDRCFIDDREVGRGERDGLWSSARRYRLPEGLPAPGEHSITIRVIDSGGAGGLTGLPVTLFCEPPSGPSVLPGATRWDLPLQGTWRALRGKAFAELPPRPRTASLHANSPSALWNGMVAPLRGLAPRGFLFYQGEANRRDAPHYLQLFPAMIAAWRREFGGQERPFYFAQIAPFGYADDRPAAAELREAQRLTARRVPGTGMASTMDVGDPSNIHPKRKRPVGERLAAMARSRVYGETAIDDRGPDPKKASREGSEIRVDFDGAEGGLLASSLAQVELRDLAGHWHPAEARIDGARLLARAAAVPVPTAIRYAWSAAPEAEIKDIGGWPASSFLLEVEAKRPNVLFIFADDHGSQAISSYGSELVRTPAIDRLATEGALFSRCFCTNGICAPSRAVALTGRMSHLNGVLTNAETFDASQPTFPRLLAAGGYDTAIIGKWHLKVDPTCFDHWEVLIDQGPYYNPKFHAKSGDFRVEGYTTDIITDRALEWLDHGRDAAKPFALCLWHKAPHRNWIPAPRHLSAFRDRDLPEPSTLFDDLEGRGPAARQARMSVGKDLTDFDLKIELPKDLTPAQREPLEKAYAAENADFLARRDSMTPEERTRWQYQRFVKDYLRCVMAVDENVARVLDWLDQKGLAENTIVVYSSDQGWFLGEHGWFDKRWIYEESLRMPLIVRWPGAVAPGQKIEAMASNLDFAATFLDAAGLLPADFGQGRSLMPLLRGSVPADWRRTHYYQYYEFPGAHSVRRHYGVRSDRWKLAYFYEIDAWELYDLEGDPKELTNVWGRPELKTVQDELTAELERLRRQFAVPPDDRH